MRSFQSAQCFDRSFHVRVLEDPYSRDSRCSCTQTLQSIFECHSPQSEHRKYGALISGFDAPIRSFALSRRRTHYAESERWDAGAGLLKYRRQDGEIGAVGFCQTHFLN